LEQKPLLEKREKILKELAIKDHVHSVSMRYDRLVKLWEAQHSGQKYHTMYSDCF